MSAQAGPMGYLSRVTRNLWAGFLVPSSSCLGWMILDHASLKQRMKLRSKQRFLLLSLCLSWQIHAWFYVRGSCLQAFLSLLVLDSGHFLNDEA